MLKNSQTYLENLNWTSHWLCGCIGSVVELKLSNTKLFALILIGHDTSKVRSHENEITRRGRDTIQTGELIISHLVFLCFIVVIVVVVVIIIIVIIIIAILLDYSAYDFLVL